MVSARGPLHAKLTMFAKLNYCNCQDPYVVLLRNLTITGVAMCEAMDNSNSACRKIKTRLITVQGSRVTLVATEITEGELR